MGSVWRTQRDRTFAPLTAKSSFATASNATSPRSSSGVIGKYGGLITERNTRSSGPAAWCGPITVTTPPPPASGAKKGRPWMWSQCRWLRSTVAR